MTEKPGWKSLPECDQLGAGTAKDFKTGDWRSEKPIWNESNCTQCMICWVVCPDASINVKDGKMTGIDYDHCKGCGICAHECLTRPDKRALSMEKEKK
ncbi:MAG: 4Fe-4S binding protein [bacterium]